MDRTSLRSIQSSDARAPHFDRYRLILEELYLGFTSDSLSAINFRFTARFCELLSITTRLTWSMDCRLGDGRGTERLVGLCRQAGGESADGFHWQRPDIVAIDFNDPSEYAMCKPCVIRDQDRFRMWRPSDGTPR